MEFLIRTLRDTGDEVVGSRIVEVDPRGCFGVFELVVDKVAGSARRFDLRMIGRVQLG